MRTQPTSFFLELLGNSMMSHMFYRVELYICFSIFYYFYVYNLEGHTSSINKLIGVSIYQDINKINYNYIQPK